jgi:hypothetical protein
VVARHADLSAFFGDVEGIYREALVGELDEVLEQARVYVAAGLDGLIFNMHDPEDLDHVRLAGETLLQLFR